MSVEKPPSNERQASLSNNTERTSEEKLNPSQEAQKRIKEAEAVLSTNQNHLNNGKARLEKATSPVQSKGPNEQQIIDRTRVDTLTVIDGRITRAKAVLDADREAAKKVTWGQRFDSTFKLGGLLGQTSRGAEAKGIEWQDKALQSLQELRGKVAKMGSLKDLKDCRTTQLGLAALPQDVVADYDKYQAMVAEGVAAKDPSSGLDVNWQAINEQLQQAEVVLDRWQTALQTIDTGVGLASGIIPGGSEVYELSRSCTSVAVGSMTADQAAREFLFGVLASKVGGKALKKLKVDEFASKWVKNNAKYFSKKTAETIARITGKAAAGGTQGAIAGTAEGTMHGTYNVATGKTTVDEAIANTKRRALTGAAFGSVLSGAGEGFKIRGEKLAARKKVEIRNNNMQLPDAERPKAAENVLGRTLTDAQKKAVLAAHDVPMKDGKKYSPDELKQKMRILEASGLSRNDADALLRAGVCGNRGYDLDDDGIVLDDGMPKPRNKSEQQSEQNRREDRQNQKRSSKENTSEFWKGDKVRVQRSDGKMDDGWEVDHALEGGMLYVRKFEDGQWKGKEVSREQLQQWNAGNNPQKPSPNPNEQNDQSSTNARSAESLPPRDQIFSEGQTVRIKRSSGAFETDWFIAGYSESKGTYRVMNKKGEFKDVTYSDLNSWSKVNASGNQRGNEQRTSDGPTSPRNQEFSEGQTVRIKRSNGTFETDWFIAGHNKRTGTYRVMNKRGEFKDVTHDDLNNWSKTEANGNQSNNKSHTPDNAAPHRESPTTPVEARLQAAEKQIRSQLNNDNLEAAQRTYLEFSLADVGIQLDKTLSFAEKISRRRENLIRNRGTFRNEEFNEKLARLIQEGQNNQNNSQANEKKGTPNDTANNKRTTTDRDEANRQSESTGESVLRPINLNATMFETLGVLPNASFDEVKSAYRKFMASNHADRFRNDPDQFRIAEDNMKIVNEQFGRFKEKRQ